MSNNITQSPPKPRKKRRTRLKHAPRDWDMHLINFDPGIRDLLTSWKSLLYLVSIQNCFKNIVKIGAAKNVYVIRVLLIFIYVKTATRKPTLTPIEVSRHVGMVVRAVHWAFWILRDEGYIKSMYYGHYALTDKGKELYQVFLDDLTDQLNGFRWRP